MGAFLAEDAGTIAFAGAETESRSLHQISLNRNKPKALNAEKPLNAEVEPEKVSFNLQMRMTMGRHWLRMLQKGLQEEKREPIIQAFKNNQLLWFRKPASYDARTKFENGEDLSNPEYLSLLGTISEGRMLDGGRPF